MDLISSGRFIRERRVPCLAGDSLFVNPKSQESIDKAFYPEDQLPCILAPGERILLSTLDVINVPIGYVGLICLRSTFARLGLLSPPTIADPGFSGTLTMGVYNASQNPIQVPREEAMWSIHYLTVSVTYPIYKGKYQNQEGITIPRALE